MSRRTAREELFKIIFESDMRDESPVSILNEWEKRKKEEIIEKKLEIIEEFFEEYDKMEEYLKRETEKLNDENSNTGVKVVLFDGKDKEENNELKKRINKIIKEIISKKTEEEKKSNFKIKEYDIAEEIIKAGGYKPKIDAKLREYIDKIGIGFKEEDKEFIRDYTCGISQNIKEIDDILEINLENWKLSRLGTVERALLRVAVYEITKKENMMEVAVNEVVEIAKEYGDEKSYEFINGVLAKIISKHK